MTLPTFTIRRTVMHLGILTKVGLPCACGANDGGIITRPDGSEISVCKKAWEANAAR